MFVKKRKAGRNNLSANINPHQRNVMKLRMTGFECFDLFVIRLVPDGHHPKMWGPPLKTTACLGISIILMSFPIVFDVVMGIKSQALLKPLP